ncbi:RNA-binding protein [archaeon]|nr:MAG: RNA-binding protein [archaeon]
MSGSASFCLFLGDLSLFCTEKDILEAFSAYGHVTNVRIKRSSENKKHLLYGFVEYPSAAEAVQAMQAMNGSLFLGRTLRYDTIILY